MASSAMFVSSVPGLGFMPSNSSANDFCRMTSGLASDEKKLPCIAVESIIVVLGRERNAGHHGQVRFVLKTDLRNEPNIGVGLDHAGDLLDLPSRRFIQRGTLGRRGALLALFAEVAEIAPGGGHDSVE